MTEPLRKKPTEDASVLPPPVIVPPPDYITRSEFETAIGTLRTDVAAQIDSALKDMRDMLNQSLKANSDQRDMITGTLNSIRAAIAETVAARDAAIKETQQDVNKLQEQHTQTQIDITNLTTQIGELTKTVRVFVETNLQRSAQLERRIEENFAWIEQRRRMEKWMVALARPVLQLPRLAKVTAVLVLASGGTQLKFNWLEKLLEILP